MSKVIAVSEKIYDGTKAKEIVIANGNDIRIQSVGEGIYELAGKLAPEAEYRPIGLVKLGDLSKQTKALDDNIYASDVSGLYSITVQNVADVEAIYISIME